jgi:hypothetical protein
MPIPNLAGAESSIEQFRRRTEDLLAIDELPDHNNVLRDLRRVGYFLPRITGCVASLVVTIGNDSEIFCDSMPDEGSISSKRGGANIAYDSVHSRLINFRDALQWNSPRDRVYYQTGYAIDVNGKNTRDEELSGRYIAISSWMLREIPDPDSLVSQHSITGIVSPDTLVADRYTDGHLRANFRGAFRVAAQWRQTTIEGVYNPRSNARCMPLSDAEAQRCLRAELDDIERHRPVDGTALRSTYSILDDLFPEIASTSIPKNPQAS